MVSPRSYRTESIVLRRYDSGEADRIVTLFTPEFGKLRVVARGIRKPKSKLASLVETFTHSSLLLGRGHNMDVVAQGEVLNAFTPLKSNLERSGCAFYVAELVSRFTADHAETRVLFDLLANTLNSLCTEVRMGFLLRHFDMNLLQCVGYRPNLHRCVTCNARLKPESNYFSPSGGGVLCPACFGSEPVSRPISVNAIKALRLLQSNDFANASRVRLGGELTLELEQLMRSYVEYLLERKVQSAVWLDKLRQVDVKTDTPSLQKEES